MKLLDAWYLLLLLLLSSGLRYLTRRGAKLSRVFNVRIQRLVIFWLVLGLVEPYLPWYIEIVLAIGLGYMLS